MTITLNVAPKKKVTPKKKSKLAHPGPSALVRLAIERRVTSPFITQDLKARGVAQVLVVLKAVEPPARTRMALSTRTAVPPDLAANFVSSELSHQGAIAAVAKRKETPRLALASKRRTPPAYRYYENLGVVLGYVTAEGLEHLQTDARVASVSGAPPLQLIHPQRHLALAGSVAGWGVEMINASRAWEQGALGEGIIVGHLDTGVDGSHPWLKDAVARFADFDDLGDDRGTSTPYDSGDHGTHTAGIIAGRRMGGRSGVAPKCQLASAVVIEGGNSLARITSALNWLLGTGARVVNLSFGVPGWWEDLIPLISIIRNRGILPIAAVGNEGPGTSRSPGNYVQVLSVGANNSHKLIWSDSSSQQFVRPDNPSVPYLVAPGVDIVSAKPGGGYQSMDGTSMAAPHVAGLCALLLSAKPGATIDQVEEAILRSCTRPAAMPAERGGAGIPDALKALDILAGPLTLARVQARVSSAARRRRSGRAGASSRRVQRAGSRPATAGKRRQPQASRPATRKRMKPNTMRDMARKRK